MRAPARAQDLILRQRVAGYRVGDIERAYARLGLEEAKLHVYGFTRPAIADLVLPRVGDAPPEGLRAEVLAAVHRLGEAHPRDLDTLFGRARTRNFWGGSSAAATHELDWLVHLGHVRVARREAGIRVFAPRPPPAHGLGPAERLERLVMLLARLLAPVTRSTLSKLAAQLAVGMIGPRGGLDPIGALLARGELAAGKADGLAYLWPADMAPATTPRRLRILAPFDPLVWDRTRMEHAWGWRYRFEAYTPAAKRTMGHYAMPLLWGDALVGWVCAAQRDGALQVETGWRSGKPKEPGFDRAFEAEIARLAAFLTPRKGAA